jgi:hypothetical protein
MIYFIKRTDGAILGRNGRWYHMFSHAGDIKVYKSLAMARKYGAKNRQDRQIVTVGDNETFNVCGKVSKE